MDKAKRTELAQVFAKGTLGEWKTGTKSDSHWHREVRDADGNSVAFCGSFPEEKAHADADSIVAAHNAAPDLLAYVDQLERERDACPVHAETRELHDRVDALEKQSALAVRAVDAMIRERAAFRALSEMTEPPVAPQQDRQAALLKWSEASKERELALDAYEAARVMPPDHTGAQVHYLMAERDWIAAAARALVEALPKCGECDMPATCMAIPAFVGNPEHPRCDIHFDRSDERNVHDSGHRRTLPHADRLRALLAALDAYEAAQAARKAGAV